MCEIDKIYVLTQSTFIWLMHNQIINVIPKCEKCEIPFKLVRNRAYIYDTRCYRCPICENTQHIRFGSVTMEFKMTIMEIVRMIFYYYARGYTVETVWREMSSFSILEGGRAEAKQMVMGMFSFMRELISERVIRDLKKSKLGGAMRFGWTATN